MSILTMVTPNKTEMQNIHEFNVHVDPVAFAKHVGNMPDLTYTQVKRSPNYHDYVADVECGFDIETTTVKESVKKMVKVAKNVPVNVFYDNTLNCEFNTVYEEEERTIYPHVYAYMYIWQFTFMDMVVYGRTWDEWLFVLNTIQNRYPELGTTTKTIGKYGKKKCSVRKRVIMWIANAGFEFQFICKLNYNNNPIVNDVFADGNRTPLNVGISTNNNPDAFTIHDALRVGSPSLKNLAKDYCVTQKMVGDLDYDVLRNSQTTLTDSEMGYCRNDVVILNEWARFYLDCYVKGNKFAPMTQTGIPRQAVKEQFIATGYDSDELRSLFPPTVGQYLEVRGYLYRGGRVGSNPEETGKIQYDVFSRDFTSSYPACILQCMFPMKPFKPDKTKVGCTNTDEFNEYVDGLNHKVCWYAKIRFKNVIATTAHSVESISKLIEYGENNCNKLKTRKQCVIVEDNGKVRACQTMTVMLTDLDYDVYRRFYRWDEIEVLEMMISEYDYLPEYITSVVKHFYKRKAELKRQGLDGTVEYVQAKQIVNAIYGMMCQKINLDNFGFDPNNGWTHTKVTTPTDMQLVYMQAVGLGQFAYDKSGKHKTRPKYLMSPYHGVWVCAWARHRLYDAIWECGSDCLYTDTDSIYFVNGEKHFKWFDEWNEKIENMNRQLFGADFDSLGDLGTFDPVVIKGTDDKGNKIKSEKFTFKTLGAKRYLKYDEYGNVEQTVAGLPKKALQNKIKSEHPEFTKMEIAEEMMREFKDGMIMEIGLSDKKTTRYNDEPHSSTVTDPEGHTEVMHSESSVAIYEIPFKLKVEDWYKALILYLAGVEV